MNKTNKLQIYNKASISNIYQKSTNKIKKTIQTDLKINYKNNMTRKTFLRK